MSDIIQILPDSVANQIAAGEVVQRPASVVKELVENAIDAGSTSIKINLKDAGKTLIQIIDNGCGMSATDARLAFERHATSKIKAANDLFAIRTMGFRGEALASIAAIANVELKTKRTEDELGTCLLIDGSELISQDSVACPSGSNFIVKNLFYNVPARRKFLKANSTELRNIITEFYRIALASPDIEFQLIHNDVEVHNLAPSNRRQRIVNIFGRNINTRLIGIDTDTSIVKISGFIGKPKNAKRRSDEQFFFVNNRYMRHSYFHKAVLLAYDKILPPGTVPPYFIFFEVDPKIIDINIHPTKTEIKFEDEQAIFQIIRASIREALGKFNIVPSIDFDEDNSLEIPLVNQDVSDVEAPMIKVNHEFNPFEADTSFNPFEQGRNTIEDNQFYQEFKPKTPTAEPTAQSAKKEVPQDWDKLYQDREPDLIPDYPIEEQTELKRPPMPDYFKPQEAPQNQIQQKIFQRDRNAKSQDFFQLKNRYILTPVRSGLMIIDQRKAHERILFEKFRNSVQNNQGVAQQTLFPQTIEFNASDYTLLQVIIEDVRALGFDIREFGKKTFVINGTPADIQNVNPKELIENLLENYKVNQLDVKVKVRENLAKALAKASAVNYGKTLNSEEMSAIIDQLFACETPNYTPDGKTIVSVLETQELDKRFR
ncbi:DNA mismatch repair endonuclease MutL [Ancylomarina sp. 16SWW S1-10-2]|uniref:DNA mismatch repair endonuclease MutL n=1 Tax=Ancylomarina sp. 16SWW S1-10-2 TaxID=2499681 RepID=UPI0012ADEF46|nr:DNA mismatch repair endonuclease MutL [Ancylomarina sp. 16SWW S1-10-2]MRT92194.1 DNA mismatch repair endonuclease MutL [Ancylomarina sp. 16SWW S1-10-2]